MGAPLAAAAAVLAGQRPPAAEEPPPQPPLPPGLSKADVAWVEGKAPLSVDALASRKLGILNFLVTCDLGPKVHLTPCPPAPSKPCLSPNLRFPHDRLFLFVMLGETHMQGPLAGDHPALACCCLRLQGRGV